MDVRQRVRRHRERMRQKGFRPREIWVPDTRTPEFAREAARESRMIAQSDQDSEDMDFIESVSVGQDD